MSYSATPSNVSINILSQIPLWKKILAFLVLILILFLFGFIIYQQHELKNQQTAIEKSNILQKELLDGITRSQAQYATQKDLEQFAKDLKLNLGEIQKDLDKLHATLTAIQNITVTSNGYTSNGNYSSGTIPRTDSVTSTIATSSTCNVSCLTDTYGYFRATQLYDVSEKFGSISVPFGRLGFSAWRQAPWDVTVYTRKYEVTTAVGMDENQRIIAYNTFTINANGTRYPIKIETADLKQIYPLAKFRFDPRMYLDIHMGILLSEPKFNMTPALSVGLLTYGKYREKPDFTFLKLGVGYGLGSNKAEFIVTPFVYNIGQHIPYTSGNIYVGPSLQVNTDGKFTVSANLGVKF